MNHAPNPGIDRTIDNAGDPSQALRVGVLANFLSAGLVRAMLTGLEAFVVEAARVTDDRAWCPLLDRCLP
jgi:hypothetical protein